MSPLLRRLVAVYAILAVGVFVFPGGLESWLDDRNASGWLTAPLAIVRGVGSVSAALGVRTVAERLRKGFAHAVGDDES